MSTESALQSFITYKCKEAGILAYNFSAPSNRGVPDLLLMYRGHAIYIEVKSPKGTGVLAKLQRYQIKQLQEHGFVTYLIDSKEKARELIQGFVERGPESSRIAHLRAGQLAADGSGWVWQDSGESHRAA